MAIPNYGINYKNIMILMVFPIVIMDKLKKVYFLSKEKQPSFHAYYIIFIAFIILGSIINSFDALISLNAITRFFLLSFVIYYFLTYIYKGGYNFINRSIIFVGLALAIILIVERFVLHYSLYEVVFGIQTSERWITGRYTLNTGGSEVVRSMGPFDSFHLAGFTILLPFTLSLANFAKNKTLINGFIIFTFIIGIISIFGTTELIVSIFITYIFLLLVLSKTIKDKFARLIFYYLSPIFILFILLFGAIRALLVERIFGYILVGQTYSGSLEYRISSIVKSFVSLDNLPDIIFGLGFGFRAHYRTLWLEKLGLSEMGMYPLILLEVGFVGLILFILILYGILKEVRKKIKDKRSDRILLFSLRAYFLGCIVYMFVFYDYYQVFNIAVALALMRKISSKNIIDFDYAK
jgi:hypothetical protein